tara:strand:+ start:285 stop:410 length:126 start_codon:yes stop_codon:yes gene_type:complete
MSQIGWLIVMYILGTLYVLAPWIAVTYLSHKDKKCEKSEGK